MELRDLLPLVVEVFNYLNVMVGFAGGADQHRFKIWLSRKMLVALDSQNPVSSAARLSSDPESLIWVDYILSGRWDKG